MLINLLSVELIFLFLSYSAYLIVRFAFFLFRLFSQQPSLAGKSLTGSFKSQEQHFLCKSFDEVYICCSFCSHCVAMVKAKIMAYNFESRLF